jgi:uncharacterized protein
MTIQKKTWMTTIFVIFLALALAINASAKTYEMTLLTVGESGEGAVGGTAKAYLDIKPGSGRIFLDSFPLTKLDTQISTRYANQIACDYIDYDCSTKDFFYTIRADSSIVGGPSASAPLTVLTIAALKQIELRNDTVMTGTINSGGSIGPVGGIPQKINAAEAAGFKRVAIPKFAIDENTTQENNTTLEENSTTEKITNNTLQEMLLPQESSPTIEIFEVSSLEEATNYLLSEEIEVPTYDIVVPDEYTTIMKEVSDSLCTKAQDLKRRVKLSESEAARVQDLENKTKASMQAGDYYSSASYCFNTGVTLRRKNIQEIENKSPERLEGIRTKAIEAVVSFDRNLEKKNITTLPELETYIIVKERLIESERMLREMRGNITSGELAYAIERYYSAVYWSAFFKMPGKEISLDEKYLDEACQKKITEAEERINYVDIYLLGFSNQAKEDLAEAYGYARIDNSKMCLFKASFAKSEANLLLSSLAITNSRVSELAAEKITSAEKLIGKETHEGFFPIMGYSYYEYSSTLNQNSESVSGLIFSEYALELSNLEMYFPQKKSWLPNINTDLLILVLSTTLLGMALGSMIAVSLLTSRKPHSVKKKRR